MDRYGVDHQSKLEWVKEKISSSHIGKTLSEEHKKKVSETISKKIKSGEFTPNTIGLSPHKKGEFKHKW